MSAKYDHEGGLEDTRDLQIQMLDDCKKQSKLLSAKELSFIEGCLDNLEYYDRLTEKQVRWLNSIWDRVTNN